MLAWRSVEGHVGGTTLGKQSDAPSVAAGTSSGLASAVSIDALQAKTPPVQAHVAGVPKGPQAATKPQLCPSTVQAAPLAAAKLSGHAGGVDTIGGGAELEEHEVAVSSAARLATHATVPARTRPRPGTPETMRPRPA
jgi:hypothetical protein